MTDLQAHRPRQPWLHELAICVDGPATAVSDASGQFHHRGAEGLWIDDERVLSLFTRRLGSDALTPLTESATGNQAEFCSAARDFGDTGPDPTVEIAHDRLVDGAGTTETFVIHNRSGVEVRDSFIVRCGGDGTDISAAKSGAPAGALLPIRRDEAQIGWRSGAHLTSVTSTPTPAALTEPADGGVELSFGIDLAPGASTTIELVIRAKRSAPSLFDADAGSARTTWSDHLRVTADDPRLAAVTSASVRDLQHLLLTDPADRDDIFAAAGTPWYLTLFGRDSLWTARFALPLGTELAAGTLRALARRQGTGFDARTGEQPGKIPHELRRSAVGSLPPVYYGTVDATALWVLLLADARRWGMPDAEIVELLPALCLAVTWLLEHSAPEPDGLIRYVDTSGAGLVNQGWKDSSDAIRFRDGSLADAPIALIEAQAYAVEACRAAAELFDVYAPQEAELAARCRQRADSLEAAVRQRFWVSNPAHGAYLGIAVDGSGRLVDGVASNMGHVLGTGTVTASEAAAIADTLAQASMLGTFGIRTLADDNGGFNPIGYHTGSVWTHDTAICGLGLLREGRADQAADLAARLVDAATQFGDRSPELHGDATASGRPLPYPASCRPQAWAAAAGVTVLQLALGLQVDVPARRVVLAPPGHRPFGALRVEGLRIGESSVTITVPASGPADIVGLDPDFTVSTDPRAL